MHALISRKMQSETLERILDEHEALRGKVQRIHSVLAGPVPAKQEIDSLLREFLDTLVIHFSNEEDDGFFSEIVAHAPRLAGGAARLCVEHRELLHEAEELCRFAAAGSPSITWWRELSSRCHEFSKRLGQHECMENKLLHEAHKIDVGVCD